MISRRQILLSALSIAAAIPAFAGAGQYPITQEQIAAAITSGGMQVSPNQVSLLTHAVARVPQPVLKLKSIQPESNAGMIARMECANPSQCLPFLVALHTDNGAAIVAQQSKPTELMVRAGASAILLLDGAHVHISVPVICLENGTLGQMVRAANPDKSQFYTVQVAGQQILKGRL